MKIKKIIRIPVFIDKYVLENIPSLNNYIESFKNGIIESDLYEYYNENAQRCFKTNVYLVDMISFIDFYILKSKLDHYYKCIYEDELNLPKSISNELFTVELDNGEIIDIFIEYSKYNNIVFVQSK